MGAGDDCALLRPDAGLELAVTTDMLVEGRHFLPGADPRSLGHKALAVNLSDLAAMGAAPRWIMLALALPEAQERWLEEFSSGLFALADRHGVDLVGGDTTRGPVLTINITALGEVPAALALYRNRAQADDDVWVSGELGGAALALSHPEIADAARRLHEPEPRVELGERLRGLAHAAIDISDGLAADLGHILARSQVAATVQYDDIPKHQAFAALSTPQLERDCVLSGGDDYELVFTAAAKQRAAIAALSRELRLRITRIGQVQRGAPRLQVLDRSGTRIEHRGGYDHFARG